MSKPSRAKRKDMQHYKLMQTTEKQVEARLKKEMNRFKGKDQFELEDHIIDLENKIKELDEIIRTYQAQYEGGHDYRVGDTQLFNPSGEITFQSGNVNFDSNSISWTMPEQTTPEPQQFVPVQGRATPPQGFEYTREHTTATTAPNVGTIPQRPVRIGR